ncbi:MAG: SEC-C metal-binding domain-containing protein [Nocardioidaceae bacterium]
MRDAADEALLGGILDEVEDLGSVMPDAELASFLEARADEMTPGEPGRAAWLSHAGEHWERPGDLARATACFEQALQDGGPAWVDARASLVSVLLERGESARVDQLLSELRRDLPGGRVNGPVHEFVGESLEFNGRLDEALRWFSAGLTYAQREDPEAVDIGCLNGRYRVRRQLGLPADRYDELCEERRRDAMAEFDPKSSRGYSSGDSARRLASSVVLHWPAPELSRLMDRWPTLRDDYGDDHDEHRSHVERHVREVAARSAGVAIVDGSVEEYVEYAQRRAQDPLESATRASYAAHLGSIGRTTPWPPGRNDRCWCGSGVKYKRCCGALRFSSVESVG